MASSVIIIIAIIIIILIIIIIMFIIISTIRISIIISVIIIIIIKTLPANTSFEHVTYRVLMLHELIQGSLNYETLGVGLQSS